MLIKKKKLAFVPETLRTLSRDSLDLAVGGKAMPDERPQQRFSDPAQGCIGSCVPGCTRQTDDLTAGNTGGFTGGPKGPAQQ